MSDNQLLSAIMVLRICFFVAPTDLSMPNCFILSLAEMLNAFEITTMLPAEMITPKNAATVYSIPNSSFSEPAFTSRPCAFASSANEM